MTRGLRKLWASRNATAAVEFALVLPIIVFMFGATIEFGRIFQVYAATNRLASQFAIAWADCSDYPAGACQTELTAYSASYSIANIAPQLDPTKLTLTMFEVTMSGTTPTIVYSYPASATLTAAEKSAAQANFGTSGTGVIVYVSYAHTLDFFNNLMTPVLGSYLTPSYTIAQLKS